MIMNFLKLDTRAFLLTSLRWTFGFWLLYVGVGKWLGGPAGFVGYIETQFAATWLPAILTTTTAWIIIIAEPLIGLWLMLGKVQRLAWIAAAGLMFMLTFGQTVLQEYESVANNWQYLILCLVAAAWTRPEE